MEFKHYSVMLNEVLSNLNLHSGGVYYDGTLGGGGHTEHILETVKDSIVIGVDRDVDAIAATKKRLERFGDRLIIVHDNFKNINTILDKLNVDKIDGALLDLGVSSYQLDNFDRGFSYRADNARLDMRMDNNSDFSAYDIVNGYDEKKLCQIFFDYGEEKFSKRIVSNIIDYRKNSKIETCGQLVEIIKASVPKSNLMYGHPAKRVFQAIRIEVNRELEGLDNAVFCIANRLVSGGRVCIITFHSLEDRIVKHAFKYLESDCICDKHSPVCICNKKREIKIITNKPIIATKQELDENSRSQSAKLRVAEKI